MKMTMSPIRMRWGGLGAAFAALLGFAACEKVIEPPVPVRYASRINLTVAPADTIAFKIAWNRISFTLDSATWDPEALTKPAIIRFYSQYGTSAVRWLSDFFIPAGTSRVAGDTVFYQRPDGSYEGLIVSANRFVFDPVDSNQVTTVQYSALALTNLWDKVNGRLYAEGSEGERCAAPGIPPGIPSRLMLANGDQYTAQNIVPLRLSFDTATVRRLVFYRYSAVMPLLDIGMLRDYLSGSSGFGGTSSFEKRYGIAGQPDSIFYIPNVNQPSLKAPEGLVRKPDTVRFDPDSLTGRGFSQAYSADGRSILLNRLDTLLPGPGKKWLAVQRLDGQNRPIGTLLYDDINIKPYQMYLQLDQSSTHDVVRDSLGRRYGVLSNSVPFYFHTFGDPTFSDTVFFWVATRKNLNRFFDGGNDGKMGPTYYSCTYLDGDAMVLDCIYETPPEPFMLDASYQVRDRLLRNFDFQTGYRVSPMGTLLQRRNGLTAGNIKVIGKLPALSRTAKDPLLLGFQVRKGSILGYTESALNAFAKQEILDTGLTSIFPEAPGWFTVRPFSDFTQQLDDFLSKPGFSGRNAADPYLHAVASQLSMDLEGGLYQHDLRGLALTTDSVAAGAKEFVIIAYARGRYFGEPRVAISRLNDQYAYVWDKIPPQFAWITDDQGNNALYDPAIHKQYAPMCYPGRCTDFTRLGGRFDVYLSTGSLRDRLTSVRDGGFGRIRSVRLLFNVSANFLGNDPLTGRRRYASPDITYDLAPEIVDRQAFGYFTTGSPPVKIGQSYALTALSFLDIDYSGWQSGYWDMWVETEDDLGNRGVAPYGRDAYAPQGQVPLRQIEIRK